MRKTILYCLVLSMIMGLFSFPAMAEDAQAEVVFTNPTTSFSEDAQADTSTRAADDESIELLAYVTSTVRCSRTISVTASNSSRAYLYRSPTATTVTDKAADYYSRNVDLYCSAYVVLSDGSLRYQFVAINGLTGEELTYYIPHSNKTTLKTVHHTMQAATTAHPHSKRCDCGYAYTTKNSTCLQCYPSYVTYDANGGIGAPAKQTVTTSPFTLSATMPTKFPQSFAYWADASESGLPPIFMQQYYASSSRTIAADTTLSLKAYYHSPITLVAGTENKQAIIQNPGGYRYFSFVPTETDTYVMQSLTDGDTFGRLFDANGTMLTSDDESGDGSNFKITYDLTAGTQYYFQASWYSSSATGAILVNLNQQHTLTYDANGGNGAPDAQTFLKDQTFQLSNATPVKDSYMFAGWADTADAETAQYPAGGDFTASADHTLYAVWTYPSGTCGENATWRFQDNTLYIQGRGAMTAYSTSNKAPWSEYVSQIERIEIAEGITHIGSYAFADCSAFTQLSLPNSITSIGSYAFFGCSGLTELTLPSGISSIAEYTFNGCSSLKQISLPQSVSAIGSHAFFGCTALRELAIPSAVSQLGDYAFSKCTSLSSINLPSGITALPAHLFDSCSQLNQIVIPSTVTHIGEFAFSGCASLTEMVIPSSVISIERAAFSQCAALTAITIPDSVATIGTSIFAYISDNVTVRCYLDTPIYYYAVDQNIRYELMSWGALEAPTFTRTETANGVTIAISAPKGNIYYTIDGSTPSASSALYTAPIVAQKNFTIKAIAVCEGWDNSAVSSFDTAIPKVDTPVPSIPSGSSVLSGTAVALSCATEGAEIWCTTDGTIPTSADVYTGPITITEDTTIYALAVKPGMLNSSLIHLTYDLTVAETVPVVTTLEATNITHNSAMVSCSLENSDKVTSVQFVYYEKNNSKARYTVEADENYRAVLSGLTPNTEYWFLAKAVNDVGWGSGHICSFMTEAGENSKPMSISLDPTFLTLNKGKSKTILATVLPLSADNRSVHWSSEDTSVAKVDANGTVTAVGLGNTRIKATTISNRLVAYCNVEVVSTEITGTFDFSEHNMITNSSYFDEHGYNHGAKDGGNALMASAYLARWDGAVLESDDPYPSSSAGIKYKELASDYHVQNILYLPYRSDSLDNDEIKSAVMKYGAVYSAFKVNYSYFSNNNKDYYLPSNVNKFNGGHAIAIVGWDDNYSRTNFSTTPPGNGAFICKNSWGTNSGENGYFYISYYDKYIARSNCGDFNAVFYDLESADNYNKIYQYDYLGPVAAKSFNSKKAYISNVFPESGSRLENDEVLEAVSFYCYSPGTSYDVYVVENYVNKSSLRNLGDPVASGMLEYAGYFTVDLNERIQLKAGTRFAIVVQYHSPGSNTVIFVELPATINSGGSQVPHSTNAKANADESYISNDGKSWTDCTAWTKNTNVCLKAFTATADDALHLQGIDNLGRAYEDDTIYSFDELEEMGFLFNPEIQDTDTLILLEQEEEVNFGSTAPSILPDLNTNNNYSEGAAFPSRYDLRAEGCMTAVKDQRDIGSCWAHATYASLESAIMKATASSSALSSDGLSQAGGAASSLLLSHDGIILPLGSIQQLVATLLPYGNETPIVWSSSNNLVASVSAHGLVTTHSAGNAYITASTADGSLFAECSVTVKPAETLKFLSIDNQETELLVGDSLLLEYSLYPSNAMSSELLWQVDDTSVAKINEYGLLTAIGSGTVKVTVSTRDGGVSATHTIHVGGQAAISAEIAADTFVLHNGMLSGDLTISVIAGSSDTQECVVIASFYRPNGEMLSCKLLNDSLTPGNNTITFSDISISGISDASVTLKTMILDGSGTYDPLVDPCSKIIMQ